jgi:hypothetical protein
VEHACCLAFCAVTRKRQEDKSRLCPLLDQGLDLLATGMQYCSYTLIVSRARMRDMRVDSRCVAVLDKPVSTAGNM